MQTGIRSYFHEPTLKRLRSACQQASIIYFRDTHGLMTTVLDMAVKAHKLLPNMGEFLDLGDPAAWEDAQEHRLHPSEFMEAVTVLTRAGHSVALCSEASLVCIAFYPASKPSDEW